MGQYNHRALVVTGSVEVMQQVHKAVKDRLWEASTDYVRLLSPLTPGLANRVTSFFIAPDGSKGTEELESKLAVIREDLLNIISGYHCNYVAIGFGGDDPPPEITSFSK